MLDLDQSRGPAFDLQDRFLSLLGRHVQRLHITGSKATGLAPCHDDKSPSFSVDLDRGLWYCFACGRGGGVKDFAELVGEPWPSARPPRLMTKIQRAALARRKTEEEARAILKRRQEEWEEELLEKHREAGGDKVEAQDILEIFQRHPNLIEEVPGLLDVAERQYSEALNQLAVLGARLSGELG